MATAVAGVSSVLPVRPALSSGAGVVADRLEGLPVAGTFGTSAFGAEVSEAVATSIAFNVIGFALDQRDEVTFRTSPDGESWSPWSTLRRIPPSEGPTEGSPEDNRIWWSMSQLAWVGEARWLQVRGTDLRQLGVELIDSAGLSGRYSGEPATGSNGRSPTRWARGSRRR